MGFFHTRMLERSPFLPLGDLPTEDWTWVSCVFSLGRQIVYPMSHRRKPHIMHTYMLSAVFIKTCSQGLAVPIKWVRWSILSFQTLLKTESLLTLKLDTRSYPWILGIHPVSTINCEYLWYYLHHFLIVWTHRVDIISLYSRYYFSYIVVRFT